MKDENWITLKEASDYLTLSPGSIKNAISQGRPAPPFYKAGGKLVTKYEYLDQWVKSNKK